MPIKYSKEVLEKLISQSFSWAEVCLKAKIKPATGAQSHIKTMALRYEINFSHFVSRTTKGRTFGPKRPIQEYLLGTASIGSSSLRQRLIKEGLKDNCCEICGLSEWRGKQIPLELDHIDSDHYNNNLDNLQILCSNCHQLETITRRKSRRVQKPYIKTGERKPYPKREYRENLNRRKFNPSKEELEKLVWEFPTSQVASLFKVSDKAIERRCKLLGIDKPPRGYWNKIFAGYDGTDRHVELRPPCLISVQV